MAPLALFAVAALYRLIPPRLAGPACFLFGLGVFAYGTTAVAVPRVDGHKAAAELVAALAPERTTIMFHGQRSASFIFNLRANSPRSDLHVLRAEKLLVHYRSGRGADTLPLAVSRAEIESYFKRFRIRYVVFESGFWTDIETIATLESVLSAAPFHLIQGRVRRGEHPTPRPRAAHISLRRPDRRDQGAVRVRHAADWRPLLRAQQVSRRRRHDAASGRMKRLENEAVTRSHRQMTAVLRDAASHMPPARARPLGFLFDVKA